MKNKVKKEKKKKSKKESPILNSSIWPFVSRYICRVERAREIPRHLNIWEPRISSLWAVPHIQSNTRHGSRWSCLCGSPLLLLLEILGRRQAADILDTRLAAWVLIRPPRLDRDTANDKWSAVHLLDEEADCVWDRVRDHGHLCCTLQSLVVYTSSARYGDRFLSYLRGRAGQAEAQSSLARTFTVEGTGDVSNLGGTWRRNVSVVEALREGILLLDYAKPVKRVADDLSALRSADDLDLCGTLVIRIKEGCGGHADRIGPSARKLFREDTDLYWRGRVCSCFCDSSLFLWTVSPFAECVAPPSSNPVKDRDRGRRGSGGGQGHEGCQIVKRFHSFEFTCCKTVKAWFRFRTGRRLAMIESDTINGNGCWKASELARAQKRSAVGY